MATFPEPASPNFDAIRQIETNDPVLGGAAEISSVVNSPINYALRALVARTQWLKQRVEGISTPAATRATAGIARLASLAQVNAGSDDETIVTPFLLQQKVNGLTPPDASETAKGIVERLTNSEARQATDTTRYPSIATLLDALRNGSPFGANETRKGVAQRATQTDVNTGTETEEFITPATFRGSDAIQSILPQGNLPVFDIVGIANPFQVTTEIIGNLGIFKLKLLKDYPQGNLTITTSNWIPVERNHTTYYNASRNQLATLSRQINYSGNNGRFELNIPGGSTGLSTNDIIYFFMTKVR